MRERLLAGGSRIWRNSNLRNRHQLRLQLEALERRHLLAGDPWLWFESFDQVPRIPIAELAERPAHDSTAIGPHDLVDSEWIVQLTESAARRVDSLASLDDSFDVWPVDFTVISGLGSPGLILLRGLGVTTEDIKSVLAASEKVESHSLNSIIEGQATPADPEFEANLLPGLDEINAPAAWDQAIGSSDIVVGVVDGGIDPTHPDLFLNIWLNQGEIPEALRSQLVDVDGDQLATFYDLNNLKRIEGGIVVASTGVPATLEEMTTATPFSVGANSAFVADKNGNGRIDVVDLLDDVRWSDGRDTDGNTFYDDLFGVNFRSGGNDPFASNRPLDELGHGTHVAGTIGAVGDNGFGVVGVNWQTSLMSLRILDNNNQSDAAAAVRAINYARQMRSSVSFDDTGQLQRGAEVRVLNNSWGQPGGYESAFESAIDQLGDEGVLFVAASGNGNLLGNGVDNDHTPFYPASYISENVVAVAALASSTGRLASFSNYGAESVDIAAPGVGIRSTFPGGGFGPANGTSMATPHVAGAAALIWSLLPEASVSEIREAITSEVTAIPGGEHLLSTGGKLDVFRALQADAFAPTGRLLPKPTITEAGGSSTEITIAYSHRDGIDPNSIGDDDLIVTRLWGDRDQLRPTLKPGSVSVNGDVVNATYVVTAPGGSWDPLDFGRYRVSTRNGAVTDLAGSGAIERRDVGVFRVRIEAPSVLYVDTHVDASGDGSLRDAIRTANAAAPAHHTIILDSGVYTIDIPHQPDASSTFPYPDPDLFIGGQQNITGWSNEDSGDFDITGVVTIVGDQNDLTVIDARSYDRVFKVHPGAELKLSRMTVSGGMSPMDQGGGGILSAGALVLEDVNVRDNVALGPSLADPIRGGGVAVWGGTATIRRSWINANYADYGGGIFFGGLAGGSISQSTISNNVGGGFHSHSDTDISISNTTISTNSGGRGAIFNRKRDGFELTDGASTSPSLSRDGSVIAFASEATNLVMGDSNGQRDIFVADRDLANIERISLAVDGAEANGNSTLSDGKALSADGRYLVFASYASNLVPGDTNEVSDIFILDRQSSAIERISVADSGEQANASSFGAVISADGRYIAYDSSATNLVANDTNGLHDVFVYDRVLRTTELVSIASDGAQPTGNVFSFSTRASLSGDGRYVVFTSRTEGLVADDTNGDADIFLRDRTSSTTRRISVGTGAVEADNYSDRAMISEDGRFVVFQSTASNLVAGDSGGLEDVFLRDLDNEVTTRLSVGVGGAQADSFSYRPAISSDGQLVAFVSAASNLVNADGNGEADVFVVDRTAGNTRLVSVSTSGDQAIAPHSWNGSLSSNPAISGNGQLIMFESTATNLVGNDPNGVSDVYLFDLAASGLSSFDFFEPTLSVTSAEQVTVSATSDTMYSAQGSLELKDVLFAGETLELDLRQIVQSNTVESSIDWVRPLTRFGYLPPVHPLKNGSPAIDQGDPGFVGSNDQLGTVRGLPDVGAHEAITGTIAGVVFVDQDGDQEFDRNEPGVPEVDLHWIGSAVAGDGVQTVSTAADDPVTSAVDESGVFNLGEVPIGEYEFELIVPDGWSVSGQDNGGGQAPSVSRLPLAGLDLSTREPSVSIGNRFIAFVSSASNLVAGDTNLESDIFVFDQLTEEFERVSIANDGSEANDGSGSPSISGDGRLVAFQSAASSLVPDDTNDTTDVFVYDRETNRIERVSVASDGTEAQGELTGFGSTTPSISKDGRFIAFASDASNLVPGDTNGAVDIFVHDRYLGVTERVSVAHDGQEADGPSYHPFLSDDGKVVAFSSGAQNLVPGDTNEALDVFVYHRETRQVERVSIANDGTEGDGIFGSRYPTLSADGRFVAFASTSRNLVPGQTDDGVFVYDRSTDTIEYIGAASTLDRPSLSADGRFVAFVANYSDIVSGSSNLAKNVFVYDRATQITEVISLDENGDAATELPPGVGFGDLCANPVFGTSGRIVIFDSQFPLVPGTGLTRREMFVAANPFTSPADVHTLRPGEVIDDIQFGLIPDPGTISGRLFEDLVANASLDAGEPLLANWIVYLDTDADGVRDDGEPFVESDDQGAFAFTDLPSYRNYVMAVETPIGWTQVVPAANEGFEWDVFLPAGGSVLGRDFGYRRTQGTGQSSRSLVSGTVTLDDGTPMQDVIVYLDSQNRGVRDPNEPATVTDEFGRYSIDSIGPSVVTVSTILTRDFAHVTPLGSEFELSRTPLFDPPQPFGNPQAVAKDDFNGDGFPDVAVALAEANKVSIRLNDRNGGFLPEEIDIEMGAGGGPVALVVGQFNAPDTSLDMAVVNNFSSSVVIFRDFDGTGFASSQTVAVGEEPIDIAAVLIGGGDTSLDLVVVNRADNTVQVLENDGSGVFSAHAAVASGGNSPVSVVATGAGDASGFQVAVAHAVSSDPNSPFGDVRVLVAGAADSLSLTSQRYQVGAVPTDMLSANFDDDPEGHIDLAVANFGSNSISILTGNGDGTYSLQPHILGTASGAFDIASADIDNDGDIDIVASNLVDRNISVFRNRTETPGATHFEPLESIGLGQFGIAQRMPLVLANFDQDRSAPGGNGTIDVVAVPSRTDVLHVLNNRLVNGGYRVELNGLDPVTGLDFVVRPVASVPTLDPIAEPQATDEDDGVQMIPLTGIAKGRLSGPPLRFVVESTNTSLIDDAAVVDVMEPNATLKYTPKSDASGETIIIVHVIDAGLDGVFNSAEVSSADDALLTRSVTVTVEPVNDPPSFEMDRLVTVSEGDVLHSFPDFVSQVSPGGGVDESQQTLLGFSVITNNDQAFATLPMIDSQGQLIFAPIEDFAGIVSVEVSLRDTGGTANGGLDQFSKAFTIDVLPINDRPSVIIGTDQPAAGTPGLQTVTGFARDFGAGGGNDELTQVVSDYLVTNDNHSLFSVPPDIAIDGTLTYTPAPGADGVATVTVQVRDSGGTALGGVDLSDPQTFRITVSPAPDTTPPTPEITPDQPPLTNQNTIEFLVDFGEPVDTFTASDVVAPGAVVSTPNDLGQGKYSVTVTRATDGLVSFSIPAGVVTDAAGNPNAAAGPVEINVDGTALVPQITTSEPQITASGFFDITVDFGEPVTGFQASDLTLINATASNLRGGAGGVYQIRITAVADGVVAMVVPPGAAKDAAQNDSLLSATRMITVDTISPLPTLRSLVGQQTSQSRFVVEVDFGEPVNGFQSSDLNVTGGNASAEVDFGDGRYEVEVTATSDGVVTVGLPANAASDAAGRASLAAAAAVSVTVDSQAFAAEISTTEPNPTRRNSFDVTVDFGTLVSGFGNNSVVVVGANLASTTPLGSGRYRVSLSNAADGEVVITVPSGVVTDASGKPNAASEPLVVTVDSTAPTPVISSGVDNPTRSERFDVVIDFGEPVSGFVLGDLQVTGGTTSNLRSFGGGLQLVSIQPAGDGPVSVAVPAGRASDAAGNVNEAAVALTIDVDQTPPAPVITSTEPNHTTSQSFAVSIDFGESVDGFTLQDVVITGGTLSGQIDQGNGRYSATVSASADGPVTLDLPAGVAEDTAGNRSLAANSKTIVVDTSRPVPVIDPLMDAPTKPTMFTIEVDFGETVSGFDGSDVGLSSGVVSALSDRGAGRYLVTLSGLAEGPFTLSLGANAAVDAAGNFSAAANPYSTTIEVIDPDAIILEGDGNTFYMNQPASQLDGIQLIDIRGTGDNTLVVDAARIGSTFAGGEILVVSDSGDQVVFDDGWEFNQAFVDGVRLVRQFVHNHAVLNLNGPDDFSNPIDIYDVNGSGDVTALDALQVINELGRGAFSIQDSSPAGQIRMVGQFDPTDFRFYDVTADSRITALDALRVINELGRRSNSSGNGEQIVFAQSADREDQAAAPLPEEQPQITERSVKQVGGFDPQQTTALVRAEQASEPPESAETLPAELVDVVLTGLSFD